MMKTTGGPDRADVARLPVKQLTHDGWKSRGLLFF
jgi:hypothetical protein